MNPERLRGAPHIAIVGSSSPVGKELKELIQESGIPVGDLKLLDTEGYAGLLQEFAGQIEITQIITPAALADTDIAFFSCSPEIMNAYAERTGGFPAVSIDLTQTGRAGTLVLTGVTPSSACKLRDNRGYFINPHPAAIVLGRMLAAFQKRFTVSQVAVTILEPASERGGAAIEELQEQTVKLLNFQTAGSKVFKGQMAFNVLPETETALVTEGLVRRQLMAVLGDSMPPPSLMALQVPVFHSEAFSMFVRLGNGADAPTIEDIRQCLADTKGAVTIHDDPENAPSPVSVIGSDKIHVGRIALDAGEPPGFGFWMTADNLRIAAANALAIAEGIMFHD